MAYFRKLASGKWRAEIVKAGTRESRGGFTTKADAKAWAAKVEADLAAGKMGRWPSKTVGDALARYKHEVSAGKGQAPHWAGEVRAHHQASGAALGGSM